MQALGTSDYRGFGWAGHIDEEDSYPLYVSFPSIHPFHPSTEKKNLVTNVIFVLIYSPLVMKVRSRSGSVRSGASTPGGGAFKSLSEGDLRKANAALKLSQANGEDEEGEKVNGY